MKKIQYKALTEEYQLMVAQLEVDYELSSLFLALERKDNVEIKRCKKELSRLSKRIASINYVINQGF